MKILRWIFVLLYVLILIGLFGYAYSTEVPLWLTPLQALRGNFFWTILMLMATLISQAVFVSAAGKIDLQKPRGRPWVLVPVIVAAGLLAMLAAAFIAAMSELLQKKSPDGWWVEIPAIPIAIFWIIWGIMFYRRLKNAGKHEVLKDLTSILITGSVLELLPAVLIHFLVTSRKHYCFLGLASGLGVSFGILVMLWAFGPGIIFLFMHAKYKAEIKKSADKVQISPDTVEDNRQQ